MSAIVLGFQVVLCSLFLVSSSNGVWKSVQVRKKRKAQDAKGLYSLESELVPNPRQREHDLGHRSLGDRKARPEVATGNDCGTCTNV